jgi:hypothetical protein
MIDRITEKIITGGKWLILLVPRLLIYILNIIPTHIPVWCDSYQTFAGVVTKQFKIDTYKRVHLGHLIVAWLEGSIQKAEFCKIVHEQHEYKDDEIKIVEKYFRMAISNNHYEQLCTQCKIW